eukprot:COSAG01_NODE_8753_length_2672_cov_1.793626_4_plen_101_part_00
MLCYVQDRELNREVYMWFPESLTSNKIATHTTPIIAAVRAVSRQDKTALVQLFVSAEVKVDVTFSHSEVRALFCYRFDLARFMGKFFNAHTHRYPSHISA